jgi:hypothetical protein
MATLITISVDGDTSEDGGAGFDSGTSADFNVFANGKGISLADLTASSLNDDLYNANPRAHPDGIASNQVAKAGSTTVFINKNPVHRLGDARKDSTTFGPGNDKIRVS